MLACICGGSQKLDTYLLPSQLPRSSKNDEMQAFVLFLSYTCLCIYIHIQFRQSSKVKSTTTNCSTLPDLVEQNVSISLVQIRCTNALNFFIIELLPFLRLRVYTTCNVVPKVHATRVVNNSK